LRQPSAIGKLYDWSPFSGRSAGNRKVKVVKFVASVAAIAGESGGAVKARCGKSSGHLPQAGRRARRILSRSRHACQVI
jgi:hypothetical protein